MRLTRLDELGARPSTYLARMRVEQLIDLPRLFAVIDADPALIGAGVVYIDAQYNIVNLRRFQAVCSVGPKRVVIQELRRHVTPQQYVEQVQRGSRESRLLEEMANMGVACTGAVLSVALVIVGGGVSAVSAGLATPIMYLGMAGAVVSVVQCGIGIRRARAEYTNPGLVDRWDNDQWVLSVSRLLDAISLLAVLAGSYNMIKYLQHLRSATGRSWFELLRPLGRQQRKALNNELLRISHPSLTKKQLKLAQQTGQMRKRLTATEMKRVTSIQIRESLANVLGIAGNATVQSIVVSTVELDTK
ncbi:NAD synthetase [Pseudomonas guariconensis]|uniref:NAD synthetase n=1 Tax=Pseudomonas guariconensis TaxID=1288410 RepID=UPI0018A9DA25|nr:NAD synthetase [Pseudomonas guariconensis]MBF8732761.1 NAD synthetase [Pseudomonas guariconensis]